MKKTISTIAFAFCAFALIFSVTPTKAISATAFTQPFGIELGKPLEIPEDKEGVETPEVYIYTMGDVPAPLNEYFDTYFVSVTKRTKTVYRVFADTYNRDMANCDAFKGLYEKLASENPELVDHIKSRKGVPYKGWTYFSKFDFFLGFLRTEDSSYSVMNAILCNGWSYVNVMDSSEEMRELIKTEALEAAAMIESQQSESFSNISAEETAPEQEEEIDIFEEEGDEEIIEIE